MGKNQQPAELSYFFGRGWQNLSGFITNFWNINQEDINKRRKSTADGKGIMSMKGMWNFIISFTQILFQSIAFIIITAAVSVVLSIAFVIVYILHFIVWLIDRAALMRHRIFVPCPKCKQKFLIPTYICPKCNREHTKLTPGRYGLFKRQCLCGMKLPSTFINNRGKLPAKCPNCGTMLNGTENVPICVPVVGGRSAGKTAYITAFSYQFIEKVAPRKDMQIKHYSRETEELYRQICSDYESGTTRMTQEENDVNRESAKAFNFMVSHRKFSPDRLITIYDVAGESFVNGMENEVQLQYSYAQGVIFMLDPLTIPTVKNRAEGVEDDIDVRSVGTLDVDLILDAFLRKLRDVMGRSASDISSLPIAVVISKGDMKVLEPYIGDEVVEAYMNANRTDDGSYDDALDAVVRKFLMENGLASFVSNIGMNFKNNRYFVCSSIGHTRERGHYNPKGVLEPMEWICQNADSGLRSVWNEHSFGSVNRQERR